MNEIIKNAENKLVDIFKNIDDNEVFFSGKVLKAFKEVNLSESDFFGTTGYGYNDIGRDKIEKIYSIIFNGEDALVRSQIISGTHAITTALFALLRPNDKLLSITGTPYDTLHEVIGIKDNSSSLKSYGILYDEIDLKDNDFDDDKIIDYLNKNNIKVVHIQRSRGYSTRKTLSIEKLERIISKIKEINKDIIIIVDNCYCEFVEKVNPLEIGADLIIGSLIKNLGAGITPNGGYIVGNKELIKLCAERLNVPGEAKEVGPSLGHNKDILMGLYYAPSVVASALKVAILTSKVMEDLGYDVSPKYNEERSDIVQTINFNDEEKLIKYVRAIQKYSAVDSNALVMPTDMPGYDDKIIMASGSFNQGSSIELSCDGPLRKPFIAYQQGSISYAYGKLALEGAIKELNE